MIIIGKLLTDLYSAITDDHEKIFKILSAILLLISFIVVIYEFFSTKKYIYDFQYTKTSLYVPLILFGIMAIINIIIFAQSGPALFLAIFFIGAVISGPDIAEKGVKIAAAMSKDSVDKYSSLMGGIGSPQYSEGGVLRESKEQTDIKADKKENK